MTGKYIYGIIDIGDKNPFGDCQKIAQEEVRAILYKDVALVTSEREITDFTSMRKDILARELIAHQEVAERIMNQGCTIIPMKLGTYAKDKEETEDILVNAYKIAKEILEKVKNRIEFDVAAVWNDFNSVLKKAGEEEEIKNLKEMLISGAKKITLDDQMKIGLMIKNILDKKKEECAGKIHETLRSVSRDFRIHELMDDRMVTNGAYLIDNSRRKEFDALIEELDGRFNNGLNFRCVGPLPPYSFYTLEVKKWRFDQIDSARGKLGLQKNSATLEEIKKAYQHMARALHPDKRPDVKDAESDFDELNKAYKMLCEYCQNGECFFTKEKIERNAILVRLKE